MTADLGDWPELTHDEAEVADALFAMLAGPDGNLQLEWYEDFGWQQTWVGCGDLERWRQRMHWFAARYDVRVGVTPRAERSTDGLQRCSVLWAVTASRESCERLQRFRPRPTVVLREGRTVRSVALWALDQRLTWEFTERGNRRLAHALRTPKKFCTPEFAVRPPGSAVRNGPDGPRMFPARINVVEWAPNLTYMARQVVAHLPEPPDPDAWRERRRAA